MSSAKWTLGLVDAAGNGLTDSGLALARDKKFTFQLGAPNMLTFSIPLTSPDAQRILAGSTYIKAYRRSVGQSDKTLKFYGPVWTWQIAGAQNALVVSALDPMAYLNKRNTIANGGPTDQGTVLKTIIDTSNTTYGDTGIRTNTANITASANVTYDWRTSNPTIMSIVQQFAGQLDGCDIWMVPCEYSSGKISDLYVSPSRGSIKNGVVFGYGPGTLTNCADMGQVQNMDKVENDVNGYAGSLAYNYTDATSIATYKRFQSYVSFTGETGQTALNARTIGRLADRSLPSVCAEYTANPLSSAPKIFDEWDIGDTVWLDFAKGISFQVQKRVRSAEVSVSRTGLETVTQLGLLGAA